MSTFSKVSAFLPIAVFLTAVTFYWPFVAEDAYITARYGENLVDLGRLVYNPGEQINALTSPLHALVEAGLYRVTGRTLLAWKVMGLLCVAGSFALLTGRVWRSVPERLLAGTLLLAPSCVVLWTLGGLETPLLYFWVATVTVLFADPSRPGPGRLFLAAMVGGLAFLTRFDSVVFFAPVTLGILWRSRRPGVAALAVAAGAVAPAAWLLFAQSYYGEFLPTSYYWKQPDFRWANIVRNAGYMGQWLMLTGLGVVAVASVFLRNRKAPSSPRGVLPWLLENGPVLAGILAALAYGLGVATHHMLFSFRIFVPFLPAATLLILRLPGLRAAEGAPVTRSVAGLAVALLVLQGVQLVYTYRSSLNGIAGVGEYRNVGVAEYVDGFMWSLRESGEDINRHWAMQPTSRERAPRISIVMGGLLPYVCRGAWIAEPLASYRHGWVLVLGAGWRINGRPLRVGSEVGYRGIIDLRLSCDYIHVMTPRHGTVQAHLPKPIENYELVSRYDIVFDGHPESMLVLFDPSPEPGRLPRTIKGYDDPFEDL